MTLSPGTLFGPYRVTALIGFGGMGEVYRGTDTRLKRDVAIKVLPPLFASDADRLARFQREAEVLASLNHANIAHIYGIEHSGDTAALAMELVDGETLAERIARGPIALDEALVIARQIAEALEAAHTRGIVHRDLKPGNVKLAPDGAVKVLDFGIAKALDARSAGAPPATSATQTGVVLGTPAYMSPEQARGKSVDERADIWAFGCVLYELLTGRPVFESDDVTLAAPGLSRHATTVDGLAKVPRSVSRTIELCLEADVRKRIRHIGDARLALEGAFETAPIAPAERSTRGRAAWITALAVTGSVALALAIPGIRHLRETPPLETRLDVATPATDDPTSFALSPDGRQIVFVATGDGGDSQLFLRSLATATAQPLRGTEEAVSPFWSPDGRSIGFFAQGSLKRLDLGGGAPRQLAAAFNGAGGTWNNDDVIVFAPSLSEPLMSVSADGGIATAITTLRPKEQGHTNPHFLPDGAHFLFRAEGIPGESGTYVGAVDGTPPSFLTPSDGHALYLSSGWLLWVRAGALTAQRLDSARLELTGETRTLAQGVQSDVSRRSAISAAETGLLAYRGGGGSRRQLTWVDRSGAIQGALGAPDPANLLFPRLAPGDGRAVVVRILQGNYDLWLLDGGRTRRLTLGPARDDHPQLSPDGTVVVFRSNQSGSGDLYKKLLDRSDPEELLLRSNELKVPMDWSSDGRFLLYGGFVPETKGDLFVLPMQGNVEPYVFLRTASRETYGRFSPDGRWVAYHSDESGRPEVYVRPFFVPETGGAGAPGDLWPISTMGGAYPTWRADGRELYYLEPTGVMVAVPITVTGNALVAGVPEKLFRTRIARGGRERQQGRQYDVAADGRFLINMELDDDVGTPITLIQNWNPAAAQP